MDPAQELERIRGALAEAAARCRRSLRSLSQEMGQHPAYWTRALAGRRPLRLQRVLELLAALRLEAHEFFEVLYPLGGAAETKLTRPGPDFFDRQGLLPLREAERLARIQAGKDEPTPAELTARAGRILIGTLRRSGLRQRDASAALGLGSGALGQALRGNAALNLEHVLATLGLVGGTPARFFAELFGPDEEDVLAGMRWSRYLDQVEGFAAGTAGGLLPGAGQAGAGRPQRKAKPRSRRGRGEGGKAADGGKPAEGRKPAKRPRKPSREKPGTARR